jgi:hypothetical protein
VEPIDVDDIFMHAYARKLRQCLESKIQELSPEKATEIMLRVVENIEEVHEPLEILTVLVDISGIRSEAVGLTLFTDSIRCRG